MMKSAIYMEDGILQLVLTPDNEFEKKALDMFSKEPVSAKIFIGSFYDCRGGWVRQVQHHPSVYENNEDKSLILRVGEVK